MFLLPRNVIAHLLPLRGAKCYKSHGNAAGDVWMTWLCFSYAPAGARILFNTDPVADATG